MSALLGCHYKPPGGSGVSGNVYIGAFLRRSCLDAVYRHGAVRVVTIIPSGFHNLCVSFVYCRLLGEFCLKFFEHALYRTVKQPADDAQCKHVLALHHTFLVKTGIGKCGLKKRGHRHEHDPRRIDAEFGYRIRCGIFRLFEILLGERVSVAYDDPIWLEIAEIGLEGGGIHRDKHISLVAGGVHILTHTHLIARHSAQRTLGRADLCRIIRERGDLVSFSGGNVGKDISRKLHAVA